MSLLVLFGLSISLSKTANSVFLIFTYLTAGLFFFRGIAKTVIPSRLSQPLNLPFIAIGSSALLCLIVTQDFISGLNAVKTFFHLLLIYVPVAVFIDMQGSEEHRKAVSRKLLFSFLAGVALLNIYGMLVYFGVTGDQKYILPLRPLKMHHIWFGNLSATGLYIAVSMLLFPAKEHGGRSTFLLLSFTFLSLTGILFSTARTVWLGIICASAAFMFCYLKNKKVFFLCVLSGAVLCLTAYWNIPIIHQRVNQIYNEISLFLSGEANTSIGHRFIMWQAAWDMFLNNPVFGAGTGDFASALQKLIAERKMPNILSGYGQAHSMYFHALATNGLLGFSALLFIFYKILRFSINIIKAGGENKMFGFLALSVAVHYMASGLTESVFNIYVLVASFAFIMGICLRTSVVSGDEGRKR